MKEEPPPPELSILARDVEITLASLVGAKNPGCLPEDELPDRLFDLCDNAKREI